MADHRYRERPGRSESIFDDDAPRERGFFERAGDELRSMFRDEGSGERSSRSGPPHEDYAGSYGRHRGGSGGYGPRGERGSHLDDHYRSWRERQISELDRDYDDYRRERQQQFESDFDTWRQGRSAGGSMGASGVASGKTGIDGQAEGSGTTTGGSGTEPMASGGASQGGGANLSATEASTGSNARTGKGRRTDQ